MNITSRVKDYTAEIIKEFKFAEILPEGNYLAVIDRVVYGLYKERFFSALDESRVFLFDALEPNKTAESALAICAKLAEMGIKRSDALVSIGGGIVQDVTGFAANIFNRGIRWIYVPTTLLAQADSCIGGKTSINFRSYKNILGTFYAPDKVYIYLDFVKTLSNDDYLSGLGEVAKFNIMSAHDGIGLLEENMQKLLSRDTAALDFFVRRSLEFKKTFIEEDEYDHGKRNLLNFAHTFGHAYETVSDYKVPHGQAVTLGLITANRISRLRGILDASTAQRVEKICLNFLSIKLALRWFEPEVVINAMKKDKKRRSSGLAAVLFSSDLSLKVFQDIKESEVEETLKDMAAMLEKTGKIFK